MLSGADHTEVFIHLQFSYVKSNEELKQMISFIYAIQLLVIKMRQRYK